MPPVPTITKKIGIHHLMVKNPMAVTTPEGFPPVASQIHGAPQRIDCAVGGTDHLSLIDGSCLVPSAPMKSCSNCS